MKKFPGLMATVFGLLASMLVVAADEPVAAVPDIAAIKSAVEMKFQQSRPELKLESVESSPIAGLYAVKIINGPVVYATADGSHFVMGDLFAVGPGGFVNLAEQQREGGRAELMAEVKTQDMIIFSPAELPAKAYVTVFTDVDCFYCQKLHKEMVDINRLGIEVRYMAFPRAGVGSDSYKKIASAWCAKNPQDAMTKLKLRQPIPNKVCPDNPVAAQYALGQKVGVTGTPALISENGRLMPGYMPALQLARALGVEVDPALASELAAKQAASPQR
jgi:thiol:disulfide interchange protein DsbC